MDEECKAFHEQLRAEKRPKFAQEDDTYKRQFLSMRKNTSNCSRTSTTRERKMPRHPNDPPHKKKKSNLGIATPKHNPYPIHIAWEYILNKVLQSSPLFHTFPYVSNKFFISYGGTYLDFMTGFSPGIGHEIFGAKLSDNVRCHCTEYNFLQRFTLIGFYFSYCFGHV